MIELQHVSAGYGAQDVVRDVSFAAPNGQLTALIGPNGSGKTTLLRAMTRTLPCRSWPPPAHRIAQPPSCTRWAGRSTPWVRRTSVLWR